MFGDRFTHSFSRVVLLLATECFFNKGQCLMCNLDKAYLMGLGSLPPDLGSYLDKLFDENTLQSAEGIPLEISMLCLGGLFVYSLAFGYRVGRNYKR
jgi:hypothetical protein